MKLPEIPASSLRELLDVVLSSRHSIAVGRARYALIVSRVQWAAKIFAILTVAWIVVDAVTMDWPLWGVLGIERLVTTAALLILGFQKSRAIKSRVGYSVAALVLILTLFLSSTYITFWHFEYLGLSTFSTTAYFYGPFLLAVGLSILPLTGLECALLAAPIFTTAAMSMFLWPEALGSVSISATLLRLILMTGISAVAGMSQLRFMIDSIDQSTRDAMTKALNRNFGASLIDIHYSFATRKGRPLSILFFDLDRFKLINDEFGHDAGDGVLCEAARSIRATLRDQDALVRWGGEEFLVVLPDTDDMGAAAVIDRIANVGLGVRPDGVPVTASVGLAERVRDKALSWEDLVKLADERMYAAKRAGRNCYVNRAGTPVSLAANNTSKATTYSLEDPLLQHVSTGLTARNQLAV